MSMKRLCLFSVSFFLAVICVTNASIKKMGAHTMLHGVAYHIASRGGVSMLPRAGTWDDFGEWMVDRYEARKRLFGEGGGGGTNIFLIVVILILTGVIIVMIIFYRKYRKRIDAFLQHTKIPLPEPKLRLPSKKRAKTKQEEETKEGQAPATKEGKVHVIGAEEEHADATPEHAAGGAGELVLRITDDNGLRVTDRSNVAFKHKLSIGYTAYGKSFGIILVVDDHRNSRILYPDDINTFTKLEPEGNGVYRSAYIVDPRVRYERFFIVATEHHIPLEPVLRAFGKLTFSKNPLIAPHIPLPKGYYQHSILIKHVPEEELYA